MSNDEKRTLEYRFTIVNAEKAVIELELLISSKLLNIFSFEPYIGNFFGIFRAYKHMFICKFLWKPVDWKRYLAGQYNILLQGVV